MTKINLGYSKSYLLFNIENEGFDDGNGNRVSLKEHLAYVNNYSGTPDCWDSIETDNIVDVVTQAQQSNLHIAIVCEDDDCEIIGEVVPED